MISPSNAAKQKAQFPLTAKRNQAPLRFSAASTQPSEGTKAAALWHLRWYVASQPHHELARVGPRGISRSGTSEMGSNSRNSNGICGFGRLLRKYHATGWFLGMLGENRSFFVRRRWVRHALKAPWRTWANGRTAILAACAGTVATAPGSKQITCPDSNPAPPAREAMRLAH